MTARSRRLRRQGRDKPPTPEPATRDARLDVARRKKAKLRKNLKAARKRITDLELANASMRALDVTRAVGGETQTKLDYLFIVTYGRSGSTLLQGILCSLPGYLIRGENREAFYRLYQYQHQIDLARKAAARPSTLTPESAWYGIHGYDDAAAFAGLREVVVRTLLRPEPDTRVIGFKEIRWWHEDWQDYLAFMLRLFPGARFIINVRNHDAVSVSKWWAKNPDTRDKLVRYERQLDAMADFLGDAVYRLDFDEWSTDPTVLAGLFEWLGEPVHRDRVEAVMQVKHSS
jgi:hypothetical protein